MQNDADRIASLAVIGSGYVVRNTYLAITQNALQLVLAADPRRFAVRFIAQTAPATFPAIVPGPPPSGLTQFGLGLAIQEYEFSKWPGIVGGEFYANISTPAAMVIVELLYLRD